MDNQQRKNIVRAIIHGLQKVDDSDPAFVQDENKHSDGDSCFVTGLFFSNKMAEWVITWSNYGPVWMGLWLDDQVKLDEDPSPEPEEQKQWYLLKTGDGLTLFPRWLAEVLTEETGIDIHENDIYDTE